MAKPKYGVSLQQVIQYLLVKRLAQRSIIEQILRSHRETAGLSVEEAVSLINLQISAFHQKIINRKCELTGTDHFVFIITDKALRKKMLEFSEIEEEYFYCIIKNIMDTQNGTISSNDAIGLSSELKKPFSVSAASEFLETLVNKGYLIPNEEGMCYLSCLTLCELENMVRGYDHVKCCLCCDLVVHGRSCPNCSVRSHTYCYKMLLESTENSRCPECEEPLQA